ncbi:hypothetical protein C8R44DRAFT_745821 [Mycena epipterygia]|nr:hypothetical protein C8R44DRAFT_745821 [Mycena epipterygia]
MPPPTSCEPSSMQLFSILSSSQHLQLRMELYSNVSIDQANQYASRGATRFDPNAAAAGENTDTIAISIIEARNLPYTIKWGKEFYVTVSGGHGSTPIQTVPVKANAKAARWDQAFNPFTAHGTDLSCSIFYKFPKRRDQLIGTLKIPFKDIRSGFYQEPRDVQLGNTATQLCISITYLQGSPPTVNMLNALSPQVSTGTASNVPEMRRRANEGVHNTEQKVAQMCGPGGGIVEAINDLPDMDEKVSELADTWRTIIDRMGIAVSILDQISEIHSFAKIAWTVISPLPKLFLQQVQLDKQVQLLFENMKHALDLGNTAEQLKAPNSEVPQIKALFRMMEHINKCVEEVNKHAANPGFWKRLGTNMFSSAGETIQDAIDKLDKLQHKFLDHAPLNTQIAVERMEEKQDDSRAQAILDKLPILSSHRSKRCLLGTRTLFLQHITDWVNKSEQRVLVLLGQAGTGKSSIAQELVQRFDKKQQLVSAVTFLRAEQAENPPRHLFTTLARGLAHQFPPFKSALAKVDVDEVLSRGGDYDSLFQSLLLDPLNGLILGRRMLVIIDAIDESSDSGGLARFLAKKLSELPVDLHILITSRPEKHIVKAFTDLDCLLMNDPKLSKTTDDIHLYYQACLPKSPSVQQRLNDLIDAAEGLFQWAAVACSYIAEPPSGYTEDECVERLLNKMSGGLTALNPLDELYNTILSTYFPVHDKVVQRRFRVVMGQIFAAFEPLSLPLLIALRKHRFPDDPDDERCVTPIVQNLGSLLSNIAPGSGGPISSLHTSFRDFLCDEKRSPDFHINPDTAHCQLSFACLSIMRKSLRFNICGLTTSYHLNRDIETHIEDHIHIDLYYASRFWAAHLIHSAGDSDGKLLDAVYLVLKEKFLFWLEVLSLKGDVALAPVALSYLNSWLRKDSSNYSSSDLDKIKELASDGEAFLRSFGSVIMQSAPHIYISALAFAPPCSLVQQYTDMFSNTLKMVQLGKPSHWAAEELFIHLDPSGPVSLPCHVSFSNNGERIILSFEYGLSVWDLTTGQSVWGPLDQCSGLKLTNALATALSSDGMYGASGLADEDGICVWSVATGELIAKLCASTALRFRLTGSVFCRAWDTSFTYGT